MKERTYLAVDLNNAEKKEMPILSINPTKSNGDSENIGITRYMMLPILRVPEGVMERAKIGR